MWFDFFRKSKRKASSNILSPNQTMTYLERLRCVVGDRLDGFPHDAALWELEKAKSAEELAHTYGLSIYQAHSLKNALQLLSEAEFGKLMERKKAPTSVGEWAKTPEIKELEQKSVEHIVLFIINKKGEYTHHVLSVGSQDTAILNDFEGLKALYHKMGGKSFILAHNHPSNSPQPSRNDVLSTENLYRYAKQNRMDFEDHFIVTPSGQMCSMKFNGDFPE